jgi:S-adenosylmethionine-diacylgycerolhomoserine-N-methlytransferase
VSYQQALKNYYRLHAPIYDATRWAFLFGRSRLIAAVADRIRPTPKRILEVGCGTGRNLVALAKAFPHAEIVGCDLSEAMIARAQKRLNRSLSSEARKKIVLRAIDVSEIKPKQFDLIVCSYMLSMTGDALDGILRHLRKCLTVQGTMAIVDFEDTRWPWFASWMRRNHVQMNGELARLLQQFVHVHVRERHSGFGLWRWLLWVGR